MRTRIVVVLTVALTTLVLWSVPTSAGITGTVIIDAAFVGGSPTGPLAVQRDCTNNANDATFPVVAPGTVNSQVLVDAQVCTITATVTDGATAVSYGCVDSGGTVNCDSNNVVSIAGGVPDGSGTITVTFEFPVPPPPVVTAAPTTLTG